MTVLMIWREQESDRLWLVSDSRISNPGLGGGIVRYSDRGAKILEAQVVLNRTESRMLGFAYAGSSLIALQAWAAVLPLWRRLQSDGLELPSIEDCAIHLGKFVKSYWDEVSAALGVQKCLCLLVGYASRPEAWLIEPHSAPTGTLLDIHAVELEQGQMRLFGSGSEEMEKLRNI